MRLARSLAPLGLAVASCGCTTVAVAVSGEQPTAEHVFERAIQVDMVCITAPWSLMPEGLPVYSPGYSPDYGLFLLYGMAAVVAYGVVDLPFTYTAYSLYRVERSR